MRIILPRPRGFCAGVEMAIEGLERALERFSPPVYAYHQIVHNAHVVGSFEARGVTFVDDIASVPVGATVVFSAHGVSPSVRREAAARRLNVVDATCPLVTKVHSEARRFSENGFTVVLVGHAGHDEAVGVLGEAGPRARLVESVEDVDALVVDDEDKVVALTQTTLSVTDAAVILSRLAARFPSLVTPGKQDICYATENRQRAVREAAGEADLVLVVGSRNSSNSNRLVEEARRSSTTAHLIDGPTDVRPEWLDGVATVVITAGASTPESLVRAVVDRVGAFGSVTLEEPPGVEEDVTFRLPLPVR